MVIIVKVLIVDDEPLARDELKYLLGQCKEVGDVKEADSIEDTLEKLLIDHFDLIMLDIHLTNESGLNLANKINKMKNPPLIVFATAYDEHALKAFELNAVDYVLKPFELERIQKAISKADKIIKQRNNENTTSSSETMDTIPIQSDESIYVVKISDIIALAVEEGKTKVFTGEKVYETNEPLSSISKKITNSNFLKVHRSYIINLKFIEQIQPWFNNTYQVTMKNKLIVPVSRSYIKTFRKKVGIVKGK